MEIYRDMYIGKSKNSSSRIIDNEAIILNLDNSYYYSLNEVGTRAWEFFDGSMRLGEIINRLFEEYNASKENLEDDLISLVNDLSNENLVALHENQIGRAHV